MRTLVVNGGSSSFKFRLDDLALGTVSIAAPSPVWSKHIDVPPDSRISDLLPPILKSVPGPVEAVGHRIVHGGEAHRESALLTAQVRKTIAKLAEFAPVHNLLQLEAVGATEEVFGSNVPQVAVFDTAFHSTLEPAAYVYPGPYEWAQKGVRRYGFHGINVEYVALRAAEMLKRPLKSLNLVVCHLGNGASVTAIRRGRSVDNSMGFTPLEGIMMGARSGSVDPGILIYLIRHRGYTAEQLDRMLNRESGLLGVSGLSSDMRDILAGIETGNARARLAFDIYVHRLTKEIGAMLALLGGSDAIVFTGGVGENCVPLREQVAERLGFLGLALDNEKNRKPQLDQDVAAPSSRTRVLVIQAQEEWQIARECLRVVTSAISPRPV